MEWIKFNEQWPPYGEPVLVTKQYLDAPYGQDGYKDDKSFWTLPVVAIDTFWGSGWRSGGRVAYWMSLPQIPDGIHDTN